jgi:signal transduction histidine kinase
MMAAADAAIGQLHEHALHAWLIARLERSYWHDVRNGLQGLYGTMDAMGRALRNPATSVPADRLVAMGRQALTAHEQSLQTVVRELLWQRDTPVPFNLSELLATVARFLRNDATAHHVTLRVLDCAPANVVARVDSLRFVLLCLAVDAIDRGGGGELVLGCGSDGTHCTVTVQWPETAAGADQAAATDSFGHELILPVARALVQAEGGMLSVPDATGSAVPGRPSVRISLPAAI